MLTPIDYIIYVAAIILVGITFGVITTTFVNIVRAINGYTTLKYKTEIILTVVVSAFATLAVSAFLIYTALNH